MTEFETKAIKLLEGIDKRLKSIEEIAAESLAREKAEDLPDDSQSE